MPLLHKRLTKLHFAPLIQQIQQKMAGWKGKFLTIAGRTTLIKSVLSSIPSYLMQSMCLPKGTLTEIERICRNFLWNQHPDQKKLHMIPWDTIKNEKTQGGLGIKDLKAHNQAFIMKLCWGILTNKEAFWVKCIRGKYGCGNDHYPLVCRKQNSSPLWKGISALWAQFYKGTGRIIKDGTTSSFWWDLWSPLNEPLIHFVEADLHLINSHATVRDLVLPNGSWDIEKWQNLLPHWIINTIRRIPPPNGTEPDQLSWRVASDSNFSVRSAYRWIHTEQTHPKPVQWKMLWKLPEILPMASFPREITNK